ncbi:MAG: T9SS type A sorting domain-containing protein [Bacteroidetes bacterium]|nr:T9SS type A sorting domain-containing protein [Bacteroidota bacterium]
MKKLVLFCLIPFFVNSQVNKKISALFLGNSYTYVNNLPLLISQLALANGDTLVYDGNTPGGYTLQNHFTDVTTNTKINAIAWKYVIIQAQSQEPSFSPSQDYNQTLPYARKLDSLIKHNNNCTNTVFYETWGRKNGDAGNCGVYPPVCTYTGMQARLKQSYKKFADTCNAVMSPVGEAFSRSIALNPTLELYQVDESHPSLEGSYLAACVFYEVLFQKSVLTNTFISTVNSSTAIFLQQVAHTVVNDSLAVWNLGKNLPWADFDHNISGLNCQFVSFSPTLLNKWYFGDAAISTQTNPNHFYIAPGGTYTVCHVTQNACKKDSAIKTIIIGSTGIYPNTKNRNVHIYPNPVKDDINIENATEFETDRSFIEITNSAGQLIFKQNFSKTVSVKELKADIYNLKIYNLRKITNLTFIKSE